MVPQPSSSSRRAYEAGPRNDRWRCRTAIVYSDVGTFWHPESIDASYRTEQIDVSIAAMSMMGLLKYVERFKGVSASDIVWQSPPIETNVISAIRYTRHTEYGDFIAVFLREKHGDRLLGLCPACAVRGVVASTCEACFTELGKVECPNCEGTAYYDLFVHSHQGSATAECECGTIVSI